MESVTSFYDDDGNENPAVYKLYCERTNSVVDTSSPAGHPVVYLRDGSKAELIIDEDEDGLRVGFYSTFVRSERAILQSRDEFREKIKWNRHQVWLQRLIERGTPITDGERPIFERACERTKEIEAKYDRSELELDDFELGLLCGRYSALQWVLGIDWDVSQDT